MRTKTAALVLTAGLVTGGSAALFVPGLASAADPTAAVAASAAATGTVAASASATDRVTDRVTAIKGALKGLVGDGTIDQAQADKVASTLAQADLGPGGGRGHGRGGRVGPEATAKVIGITVDQLRTAQQAGQTLTRIAQAHGVSRTDLVNGLVTAAKTQLAADVKAGATTQAQADTITSTLPDRISQRVDQVGRGGRDHGGPGGWDRSRGSGGSTSPSTPGTPSAPTPSPSATS